MSLRDGIRPLLCLSTKHSVPRLFLTHGRNPLFKVLSVPPFFSLSIPKCASHRKTKVDSLRGKGGEDGRTDRKSEEISHFPIFPLLLGKYAYIVTLPPSFRGRKGKTTKKLKVLSLSPRLLHHLSAEKEDFFAGGRDQTLTTVLQVKFGANRKVTLTSFSPPPRKSIICRRLSPPEKLFAFVFFRLPNKLSFRLGKLWEEGKSFHPPPPLPIFLISFPSHCRYIPTVCHRKKKLFPHFLSPPLYVFSGRRDNCP